MRTSQKAAGAIAVATLITLLCVAAPAAADPVPASCPHLTIEGGEFEFIDEPPAEFVDPVPGRTWDCVVLIPGDRMGIWDEDNWEVTRWEFDLYDVSFERFLELADAAFADDTMQFQYGGTTDEHLQDDARTWTARSVDAPPPQAYTTFERHTAPADFSYQIWWQRADAGGSEGMPIGDDGTMMWRTHERSFIRVTWTEFIPLAADPAPASDVGASAPSTISELKTVLDAVPTPFQAIVLTLAGALLTVFIGLPSALVSGVLSARWERWFGWARRPTEAVRRVTDRAQHPWVFWVGIVIASLIAAFVDPKFGVNWLSLRLYLTLFVAFAVFNVGAWLVIARVLRRLEPELPKPVLQLRIGSLFVLLLGVLVSRLLVLEPGIVFGIVAGLVFATTLVASRRAGVVLVGTGFAAAAGVAAWILYSVLTLALGGMDNVVTVGAIEFFGGLTLQGLSALPVALLPFAVLDGGALFRWNRPIWVAVYLGATVLFLLVLVNVPNGTTAVPGDFLRWLGLYFAFAVVATAIWGVDRLVERRREAPRLPESEGAR